MYSSAYVWAKVLSHMEERLGAVTVSAWFDDAEVVEEVQETTQPVCPTELQTQEAEKLFEKLREAGMVDARMQPLNLSNAEKGMLAFDLAGRLDIQNQWQVFATLWGTTPGALRSAYNRAIEQQKTMLFIEKLKNILN